MKYLPFAVWASLLVVAGCNMETEIGEPYEQPGADTEPFITFSTVLLDNGFVGVPSYVTFGADSADMKVTFGAQTIDFAALSSVRLYGYGFDEDAASDTVFRFSEVSDTRGIHGTRIGYSQFKSNSSEVGEADFHIMAKDINGDIYLTETSSQERWQADPEPYLQPEPKRLFKAQIEVGESWVSQASFFPWFYDANLGWKGTLVADDAVAPTSGEENCVLLKFQKENVAYYMYLKDGIGIVEILWNWENENNLVKPILGYSYKLDGGSGYGPEYTGFGYGDSGDTYDASLTAKTYAQGYTVLPGEAPDYADWPTNESDYTVYRVALADASSGVSFGTVTLLYDEQNNAFITDTTELTLADAYQPIFTVISDGETFFANSSFGDLAFDLTTPMNNQYGYSILAVNGTLVKQTDTSVTKAFTAEISMFYQRVVSSGDEAIISYQANVNNELPSAVKGAEHRFDFEAINLAVYDTLPTKVYYGTSPDSVEQLLKEGASCYNADADGDCISGFRSAFVTLPDVTGDIYIQFEVSYEADSEGAYPAATVRSPVYSMSLLASAEASEPVAQFITNFPQDIRGSRDPDTGEFLVYLDATKSYSLNGSILRYDFDFGDGTVVEDKRSLGTYTYTDDGEYTISLTVTDSNGASASYSQPVCVSDYGSFILQNQGQPETFSIQIGEYDETDETYYSIYYNSIYIGKGEVQEIELEANKAYIAIVEYTDSDLEENRSVDYFSLEGCQDHYFVPDNSAVDD